MVLHYTMVCDCQQFLHAYPSQNVNKPLMEFWYIQLQQREKATNKSRTFHSDVNRLNGTKQTKLNELITKIKKQKVFVKHVLPWYNHTGWLGVKCQFTYLWSLYPFCLSAPELWNICSLSALLASFSLCSQAVQQRNHTHLGISHVASLCSWQSPNALI